MGIFGRHKQAPASDLPEEEVEVGPPPGEPGVDRDWERHVDGPYDLAEVPELGGRIDLGPLRVPAAGGMELRLDVEPASGQVIGVTLGVGGSRMQLQAFAAPRSSGIWREIREEITASVRRTGGTADSATGVLGTELRCRMPGKAADGRVAYQPARFLGVDGPRWFLRAVVNGPAAADDAALRPLLGLLRQVVVDRGDEPRPPREVLALQPPKEIMEAMAQRAAAARAAAADEPAADPQDGGPR